MRLSHVQAAKVNITYDVTDWSQVRVNSVKTKKAPLDPLVYPAPKLLADLVPKIANGSQKLEKRGPGEAQN